MGQGSVLGRASSKVNLPDMPAMGAEVLMSTAFESPEKSMYDVPAEIE